MYNIQGSTAPEDALVITILFMYLKMVWLSILGPEGEKLRECIYFIYVQSYILNMCLLCMGTQLSGNMPVSKTFLIYVAAQKKSFVNLAHKPVLLFNLQ